MSLVSFSEIVDKDAIEIGNLYRRACSSLVDSALFGKEAGTRLIVKKSSTSPWLEWLHSNENVLGFGESTAQRFMQFAVENPALTQDSPPEVLASAIRKLWGNKPQSLMDVHYSSDDDTWETPQDLFDQLNGEFNFEIDVCALPKTAKCERYFSPKDDGLSQEWTGICWMNPPYGDVIGQWVSKAKQSSEDGATVVCLVPARVDTNWWWDNCRYGEIRFLKGRLKFGGGDTSAPFPSAVVVFGKEPTVIWWER